MKKDKGPSVAKKVGMKLDSLKEKPMMKAPVGVANQKGPIKMGKPEPKKEHKKKHKE